MLYAAYGSNLHPLRLTQRIASARLVATRFLPGWSLHFHKLSQDGSGKCNILRGGDGVHFAIFDICTADKRVLDRIEGVGVGYSNASLSIPGLGDCATYAAQPSHIDDSLAPYDWYKELVLTGARLHGFPDKYLDRIESTLAHADPHPDRRIRSWKTVDWVKTGTLKGRPDGRRAKRRSRELVFETKT